MDEGEALEFLEDEVQDLCEMVEKLRAENKELKQELNDLLERV